MRVKLSFTLLVLGLSLTGLTTGCRKKVAVAQPTPPPPVQEPAPPPALSLPTASLSAEPALVEAGQAVTLKWSSTDATDATISGLGAVTAEGTQEVHPSQSTTYELVATGPGGSAKASATVNVIAPPLPILAPPEVEPKSLLVRLQTELSDAYFDLDESNLRDDARAALEKDAEALRSILTDFPNAVIVLEGHCDERGSAEYNVGLGAERVLSARAYLAALGVQADRLRTISYGKERPQCNESSEACWQMNRRVHFASGETATN
jgi:peptidoglycan-associated lipoprotein